MYQYLTNATVNGKALWCNSDTRSAYGIAVWFDGWAKSLPYSVVMSLDSVFIVTYVAPYEGECILSVHSSEMLANDAKDAHVCANPNDTTSVTEWSLDGRKDAVFEAEMVDFIAKIKGSA